MQPYVCDYDPDTGAPYPRITHMQFFCDPAQVGFANFYEVGINATDNCDYTLKFKTNIACLPGLLGGLSGGWVFNIIVMSGAALYLGIGSFLTYRKEKIMCVCGRGRMG